MKHNFAKIVPICLLAAILLFGCEGEHLPAGESATAQEPEIETLKKALTLKKFREGFDVFFGTPVVDWDSYLAKETDSAALYEFKIGAREFGTMESELQSDDQIRLVGTVGGNGNMAFSIIKLKPSPGNGSGADYWASNLEGFSGTLYRYNIKGDLQRLEYWENGEAISSVTDASQRSGLPGITARCAQKINTSLRTRRCNSLDPACVKPNPLDPCRGGGSSFVPVTTYHYTDWYKVYPSGTREYTHTQYNGKTVEYVYVSNGTSSSYTQNYYRRYNYFSNRTGGYYSNGSDDLSKPIRITNLLTGKAKCLNNALTLKSYVKNLLSHFKGESEFNIKIVSKDKVTTIDDNGNVKEVNGSTSPIINKEITITISTDKVDKHSALEATRTILHEYIHADIRRKLKTKKPSSDDREFKDDFEQYGKDHHEAMGALYVNSMRDVLKDFHKTVLKEDYDKYTAYYEEPPSDAFYEALAWIGLKHHNVKAWTSLEDERKQELDDLSLRVDLLTKTFDCPD